MAKTAMANCRRRLAAASLLAMLAVPAAGLAYATLSVAPATAHAAGGKTSTAATSSVPLPDTTNPFSPGVPLSPVTTPTPTSTTPTIVQATTSSSGSSGLSGNGAVAIAIGAIVVLGGISFFIWRDARRHAPTRSHSGGGGGSTALPGDVNRGSKAQPKSRKLSPAERRRRKRGRAGR